MMKVSQCDIMQQFKRGLSLRREQKGQSSTSVALCDGDGGRSVAVGMIHQQHPPQPQQSLLLQVHRNTNFELSTIAEDTVEDNKKEIMCEAEIMQPGVSQKGLLALAAYATAHSSRFPISLPALLQFLIALPLQWCNITFGYWGLVRLGGIFLVIRHMDRSSQNSLHALRMAR